MYRKKISVFKRSPVLDRSKYFFIKVICLYYLRCMDTLSGGATLKVSFCCPSIFPLRVNSNTKEFASLGAVFSFNSRPCFRRAVFSREANRKSKGCFSL